jgi:hypothetical protein
MVGERDKKSKFILVYVVSVCDERRGGRGVPYL